MRVIFMGTPLFAIHVLDALISKHDVVAVFTRADAVRGRGKSLVPSPVKQVACAHDIPVMTPKTLRDPHVQQQIVDFHADIIVVAAYGMILPTEVLHATKYGCVNVHASLLPRWRGAAPIQRAILAGDSKTGVSIMRMEEGLDTGDVCETATVEILKKPLDELTDELSREGSTCLLDALDKIADGSVEWKKQEGDAVYASKIEKHELDLWTGDSPEKAWCKVRASSDGYPAKACMGGRTVRIEKADIPALRDVIGMSVIPRQLLLWHKRLFMGFSSGPMEILQVRPDGKKSMTALQFAAGIQGIKHDGVEWHPTEGAAKFHAEEMARLGANDAHNEDADSHRTSSVKAQK